jgi:hypothetical protein
LTSTVPAPAPASVRRLRRRQTWLSIVRPLICSRCQMPRASSSRLKTRTGCGEGDEQLELHRAQAHDDRGDLDGPCGQVDVHRSDVHVAPGDVVERSPHERCQDRAQQDVAGAVGQVVVAFALIGPQDRQLVRGAEHDDRLSRVDSRMVSGADRA